MRRIVILAVTIFYILSTASFAYAGNEVMTDRCSAEVAIVPSYDARIETPGTVILKRGSDGSTAWTPPFAVQLGKEGHIRWLCHSTIGNQFDPGTWRIGKEKCSLVDITTGKCSPSGVVLTDSSLEGWTPERSRCNNRSTKIRARLGSNRLLQIECLGK